MKYGLIGGGAMIGWTLAEYALGLHNGHFAVGRFTGWGAEVILVLMLWRMLRVKIERLNRYWLPAWEGMFYGVLASAVAGLVFYSFLNVYVTFINPEWPDLYLEWQVTQMRNAGNTEEAVRAFVRSFRWMSGPLGLAALTIGLYSVIGGAFSAILTLWLNLRRKEPAIAD